MKQIKFLAFQSILVFSMLIIQGCSSPKGCTDLGATNFDPHAKSDCDCCTYEGSVVFWFDLATAHKHNNGGAVSFSYFVDGQLAGYEYANRYCESIPYCVDGPAVKVIQDLGTKMGKPCSYRVVDQNGKEWYAGSITIKANECRIFQLQ